MRHIPIAAFKDKVSEIVAAAEAGEDVVITRHGRDVVRLVGIDNERLMRQRAAVEAAFAFRRDLHAAGVRVSSDEFVAWKNEDRR